MTYKRYFFTFLSVFFHCILNAQVYDYFNPSDTSNVRNIIRNHADMGYVAYSRPERPYPLRTDNQGYQHDEEIQFIRLLLKKAYKEENIMITEGTNCVATFLMNKNGKIDCVILGFAELKDDRVKMNKLKSISADLIVNYRTSIKPSRNYYIVTSFQMPKYSTD